MYPLDMISKGVFLCRKEKEHLNLRSGLKKDDALVLVKVLTVTSAWSDSPKLRNNHSILTFTRVCLCRKQFKTVNLCRPTIIYFFQNNS